MLNRHTKDETQTNQKGKGSHKKDQPQPTDKLEPVEKVDEESVGGWPPPGKE